MSGVELLTRNVDVAASDATEAVAAVERALANLPGAEGGQVTLVLTDDDEITALNREYRSIDAATDVLSFPFDDEFVPEEERSYLGDVVIALPYATRQAQRAGHSVADELALLAVHGLLHLLGYDDETDEGAARMRAMERSLGVRH